MSPSADLYLKQVVAKIRRQQEGVFDSSSDSQLDDLARTLGLSDQQCAQIYRQALESVWREDCQSLQSLRDSAQYLAQEIAVLQERRKRDRKIDPHLLSSLEKELKVVSEKIRLALSRRESGPSLRATRKTRSRTPQSEGSEGEAPCKGPKKKGQKAA